MRKPEFGQNFFAENVRFPADERWAQIRKNTGQRPIGFGGKCPLPALHEVFKDAQSAVLDFVSSIVIFAYLGEINDNLKTLLR